LVGVSVGVLVGGTAVLVGGSVGVLLGVSGVLVGVSVGVLVGGTAVFVGVSVGVLVGGTAVFVGVSVAVGWGVEVYGMQIPRSQTPPTHSASTQQAPAGRQIGASDPAVQQRSVS